MQASLGEELYKVKEEKMAAKQKVYNICLLLSSLGVSVLFLVVVLHDLLVTMKIGLFCIYR